MQEVPFSVTFTALLLLLTFTLGLSLWTQEAMGQTVFQVGLALGR